MKIWIISLLLFSSSLFAKGLLQQTQDLALTQAAMTFSHLGEQLEIEVIRSSEQGEKIYVELGIGTKRRPNRIHNCYVATISNNGFDYIRNLEQRWDENCP